MEPERLGNGKIRAQVTFTTEDGGQPTAGEAVLDLAPGDPMYDEYDEFLKAQESQ